MLTLPEAIVQIQSEFDSEVIYKAFKYRSDIENQKILFTHNTLAFFLEGKKTIQTPLGSIALEAPTLFFLKKGEYAFRSLLGDDSYCECALFFFTDRQIENFILKYSIKKQTHADEAHAGVFILDQDEKYWDWLQGYLKYERGNTFSEALKLLRLEELFLLIKESSDDNYSLFHHLLANSDYVDMLKPIEANLTNPISLEELASLSNMSLSTFKRKFQQEFGVSPGRYIRRRKLEIAKEEIIADTKSLIDIYLKIGYENYSSFLSAFKKEFGLSPQELKKKFPKK